MAKTLTGASLTPDSITATYTEGGTPGSTTGPWAAGVTTAAASLRTAVADDLGAPADTIQLYTAASNSDGAENADPGDIVDAWTGAGGNPDVRYGAAEAVPGEIATARDSLKTVLQAAL